jgi:fructose-1,6-bisphosphatase/inositol monophosphatase family enzyme
MKSHTTAPGDYFSALQVHETVSVLRRALELAQSIGNASTLKTNVHGHPEVVTKADPACEKFVIQALGLGQAGGPACVGEEGAYEHQLPANYDALDPIDGTLSFARGVPRWGILLGAIRQHRPVAGIALQLEDACGFSVDVAAEDARLWNHQSMQYSKLERPFTLPKRLLFTPGYYTEATSESIREVALQLGLELAPAASAVHASVLLAKGEAAAFLCYGGKVWDQAPLAALLQFWGGGEIDVSSLSPRDWSSIGGKVVQGFEMPLLRELAQALRQVKFEGLAPDRQWVPQ